LETTGLSEKLIYAASFWRRKIFSN
jgi:hypothetical protein